MSQGLNADNDEAIASVDKSAKQKRLPGIIERVPVRATVAESPRSPPASGKDVACIAGDAKSLPYRV